MGYRSLGILLIAAGLVLAGCNRDGRDSGRTLINIRSAGLPPDEFLVLPRNPLQAPPQSASLPPPTPGGANLADPDIDGPLMAALGSRGQGGGIPGSEAALVRAVGAAQPDIRALVAEEDAAFRQDNAGRLERRARLLQGASVYSGMLLDPYAEAARLRALGITVPLAPAQ